MSMKLDMTESIRDNGVPGSVVPGFIDVFPTGEQIAQSDIRRIE